LDVGLGTDGVADVAPPFRLAVAVLTVPPDTDGPPRHWHQKHDETFYVIAGTARFTVGETQHEVSAGTFVSVAIGAEHTSANPGDEPAIILNTFTPDLYGSYFRDLGKLAAPGDAPCIPGLPAPSDRSGTPRSTTSR
jgi:quercetin dioxygenase-like cupin family protein